MRSVPSVVYAFAEASWDSHVTNTGRESCRYWVMSFPPGENRGQKKGGPGTEEKVNKHKNITELKKKKRFRGL